MTAFSADIDVLGTPVVGIPGDKFPGCPFGTWTRWFNVDDGDDSGDFETLAAIRQKYFEQICAQPTEVDGRNAESLTPAQFVDQDVTLTTELGLICRNTEVQSCDDYEVRFCCPSGRLNQ